MTPDRYQTSNSGYKDEWGGFWQRDKGEVKSYALTSASALKTERNSASILKPVLFLVLGIILMGVAWWSTDHGSGKQKIKRQRREFFATNGIALSNQEEQRNREAMERARQQLASDFARYHNGAPRFADDLTTWSAQYQIAKAALADWWSKSNEGRKVATDKFAEFVVSDRQLQKDVIGVIAQFSSDLEANRNKMLSELQEKVSAAAVPCASAAPGSTNLARAFALEAGHLVEQQTMQSSLAKVLAEGGGFMAGAAATHIVTKLMTSMAIRVATSVAARGSTVAGGVLAGGEGGTVLAPGVGTAVGAVGGIVAAWAVDWWMEKKFKEKVTNECNRILDDMEKNLWNDPSQGLALSFGQAIQVTRECHEKALRTIITGDDK
jgi:hypothetical protein